MIDQWQTAHINKTMTKPIHHPLSPAWPRHLFSQKFSFVPKHLILPWKSFIPIFLLMFPIYSSVLSTFLSTCPFLPWVIYYKDMLMHFLTEAIIHFYSQTWVTMPSPVPLWPEWFPSRIFTLSTKMSTSINNVIFPNHPINQRTLQVFQISDRNSVYRKEKDKK